MKGMDFGHVLRASAATKVRLATRTALVPKDALGLGVYMPSRPHVVFVAKIRVVMPGLFWDAVANVIARSSKACKTVKGRIERH